MAELDKSKPYHSKNSCSQTLPRQTHSPSCDRDGHHHGGRVQQRLLKSVRFISGIFIPTTQ
jgi:hypothetical protein